MASTTGLHTRPSSLASLARLGSRRLHGSGTTCARPCRQAARSGGLWIRTAGGTANEAMKHVQGPTGPGDDSSIEAVFDWYLRRLTADRFSNRKDVVVPRRLSGWVVSQQGEAADPGGLRPMGAVREALDALVREAGLDDQQLLVIRSKYGLSEYPSSNSSRPLERRVPRQRGKGALRERRTEAIAREALHRIVAAAEAIPKDPSGRSVVAAPVADPSTAPWFLSRVKGDAERFRLLGLAVDAARAFVATTGTKGEAGGVLADVDDYYRRLITVAWPTPRPLGRSRARAVVGVSLWMVLQKDEESAALAGFQPSTSGVREPPEGFTVPTDSVGAFVAGDRSNEIVAASCAVATSLVASDRVGANVIVDLLLGGLETGHRLMSAASRATVLRTAVRIRSTDEDPTAIALARAALVEDRNTWQTIDTVQSAVKVASAFGRWSLAQELCDEVSLILAGQPDLPVDRALQIERIEYGLWTLHQRSATLRRQVDAGGTQAHLRSGLRAADQAERLLDEALRLRSGGAPGDATIRWGHDLAVRRAELHLLAAERLDGKEQAGHRQAAEAAMERAGSIARASGLVGTLLVPLTKVALQGALMDGESELAAALLRRLHDYGWPLRRTLPVIFDVVENPGNRAAVPAEVGDAVDEIVTSEARVTWMPAASDAARRRLGRPAVP